ncbi:hypothetical protein GCM10027160_28730 [Streptomyces calidiresistens]|nr:hypothetical protein [Streptomyces calidiresistens]
MPEQTVETESVFAPKVTEHEVDELTLGRQNFNDSDKSNYFESSN